MNQELKRLQEERKILEDQKQQKDLIEKEKRKIKELRPKGFLSRVIDKIMELF